MFDYTSPAQSIIKEQVTEAKKIIAKFRGRWGNLNKKEKVEIDQAERLLEDARRRCNHDWVVTPLFSTVKRICETCDQEDTSYDHAKARKAERFKLDWP